MKIKEANLGKLGFISNIFVDMYSTYDDAFSKIEGMSKDLGLTSLILGGNIFSNPEDLTVMARELSSSLGIEVFFLIGDYERSVGDLTDIALDKEIVRLSAQDIYVDKSMLYNSEKIVSCFDTITSSWGPSTRTKQTWYANGDKGASSRYSDLAGYELKKLGLDEDINQIVLACVSNQISGEFYMANTLNNNGVNSVSPSYMIGIEEGKPDSKVVVGTYGVRVSESTSVSASGIDIFNAKRGNYEEELEKALVVI